MMWAQKHSHTHAHTLALGPYIAEGILQIIQSQENSHLTEQF